MVSHFRMARKSPLWVRTRIMDIADKSWDVMAYTIDTINNSTFGSIWKVRKPCKFRALSSFFPLPLWFDLGDLDGMPELRQTRLGGAKPSSRRMFNFRREMGQSIQVWPIPRLECTEILYKMLSMTTYPTRGGATNKNWVALATNSCWDGDTTEWNQP